MIILTFNALSPHFSIAASPCVYMWFSRSDFSSPKPSCILDTRVYILAKSTNSPMKLRIENITNTGTYQIALSCCTSLFWKSSTFLYYIADCLFFLENTSSKGQYKLWGTASLYRSCRRLYSILSHYLPPCHRWVNSETQYRTHRDVSLLELSHTPELTCHDSTHVDISVLSTAPHWDETPPITLHLNNEIFWQKFHQEICKSPCQVSLCN